MSTPVIWNLYVKGESDLKRSSESLNRLVISFAKSFSSVAFRSGAPASLSSLSVLPPASLLSTASSIGVARILS